MKAIEIYMNYFVSNNTCNMINITPEFDQGNVVLNDVLVLKDRDGMVTHVQAQYIAEID